MATLNDLLVTGASRFVAPIQGTISNALKDGNGNVISSYYCTLGTNQTLSGNKTFSGEVNVTGGLKESGTLLSNKYVNLTSNQDIRGKKRFWAGGTEFMGSIKIHDFDDGVDPDFGYQMPITIDCWENAVSVALLRWNWLIKKTYEINPIGADGSGPMIEGSEKQQIAIGTDPNNNKFYIQVSCIDNGTDAEVEAGTATARREVYSLPAPSVGLLEHKYYDIWTTQTLNITYSPTEPARIGGAIWLSPIS